jgi:F-type H+-transporting ATPase subunit c
MTEHTWIAIVSIVMAGVTVVAGAFGAALGESRIGTSGMDAIARQPEAGGSITRNQFVALAMVESTAIFCLVLALILLFANPFAAR